MRTNTVLQSRPWFRTFLAVPIPPAMTRPEFIAAYFPRYVEAYRPPSGIRMVRGVRGNMHVQMSTRGSVQSQETKRTNRVDEAYAAYLSDHAASVEMDSRHSQPSLPL